MQIIIPVAVFGIALFIFLPMLIMSPSAVLMSALMRMLSFLELMLMILQKLVLNSALKSLGHMPKTIQGHACLDALKTPSERTIPGNAWPTVQTGALTLITQQLSVFKIVQLTHLQTI